jgi:hypothetical protein
MKTRKQQGALAAGAILLGWILFATWRVWSQTAPPALSITLTGTNTVTLTVTNGVSTNLYEIWWTEFLSGDVAITDGAWIDVYDGTTGQTNFPMILGDTDTGFFRAVNGNDFDNDGIPNWEDARPFDPSVGILRVTIESPANGSNVQ